MLGGVASVANFITDHEQTPSNECAIFFFGVFFDSLFVI